MLQLANGRNLSVPRRALPEVRDAFMRFYRM